MLRVLDDELFNYATRLVNFIQTKEFAPVTQRKPYYHMGATITDAILQAGLNYQFAFLEMAGISHCSYNEASLIYAKAAELLNISLYELDKKI